MNTISLRNPEIPLGARQAAADRIRDTFSHRNHRKAPVETEAGAAEVAPGALVKLGGIEGAVKAGLEVAQEGVNPTELRQVVWVFTAVDNSLVVAACHDHGTKAGQSIREHLAAECQMVLRPVSDCLKAEAT